MEHRCPGCGLKLPQGVPAWARQVTVADYMTKDPVTMGPEDTLMRALELTRLHHIRHIPIVIEESLVGLVADSDLKRAQPSALSDSQEEFDRVMEETPVSRIMINEPACTREDVPLLEAARILHSMKYGALPVTRGGRVVGILTDHDVIRACVDLVTHAG